MFASLAPLGALADPPNTPSPAERAAAIAKMDALSDEVAVLLRAGDFAGAGSRQTDLADLRLLVFGADDAEALRAETVRAVLQEMAPVLRAIAGPSQGLATDLELASAVGSAFYTLWECGVYTGIRSLYRAVSPFLDRALEPGRLVDSTARLTAAVVWNNAGVAVHTAGDLRAARTAYERALALYETAVRPDHPNVAAGVNNLAMVLVEQAEYAQAETYLKRSLAALQALHGQQIPEVAVSLNNLAYLYTEVGRLGEAQALGAQAIALARSQPGFPAAALCTLLVNAAAMSRASGDLPMARELGEEALQRAEQDLGAQHAEVASILDGLARTLELQGLLRESLPMRRRALALRLAAGGPDHPGVAYSLTGLARLLMQSTTPDEAIGLLQRALRILERALGPDHPDLTTVVNSLGLALRDAGRTAEARACLERACRLDEALPGARRAQLATSLTNLALSLLDAKDFQGARERLERALELLESSESPDPADIAIVLCNLAATRRLQGDPQGARAPLARAMAIGEARMRTSLTTLTPAQRMDLLSLSHHELDLWLELVPEIGETGYAEVLRFKGIAARTLSEEHGLERHASPEVRDALERIRAARCRLALISQDAPSPGGDGSAEGWRRRYALAAADLERATLGLRRSTARDLAPKIGPLTPEGVEQLLAEDQVLVDVLRTREEFMAWVVRRGAAPVRVELGSAVAIEQACRTFAAALRSSSGSLRGSPFERSGSSAIDARLAGAALRALTLDKLLPTFGHTAREILFCADDALAAVPLAALPEGDAAWFGERYLLRQLTMAQDLSNPGERTAGGSGALLVGGVDFSDAEPEPTGSVSRERPQGSPARAAQFEALPGTVAEVLALHELLGPYAEDLIGASATESAIRARAHGKRIVHLATHGFVGEDPLLLRRRPKSSSAWLEGDLERHLGRGSDPMLLAGLACAGANTHRGGSGDDGLLTALEATRLDLEGVELVVLSACETAAGTPQSGQGVLGLVQGFQIAGARQVLGSLWRVDDEATRLLMVEFHRLLRPVKGQPRRGAAEALRDAQAFLRNYERAAPDGTKEHPYAAPFFWAPWLLWGRGAE